MPFKRYHLYPRVIQDLKKRSTIGIIFYLLVICIVLYSGGYYLRHPDFSRRFLILISGICIFRFVHLFLCNWLDLRYEKISNAVFLISVILTGLIWGVGFAEFMIQQGEPEAKLFMVMCTIGLCSGGAVAFIPEFRLSMMFSLSMLFPAAAAMVVHRINSPLILAIVLFLAYMGFVAKRGNKEYWDALENEKLLQKQSDHLRKMSRTDDLTGLFNRRHFDKVLSLEWNLSVRHKTELSVVICDIDNFKKINDKYGHPAGDAYLKSLAGILNKIFRRKTDLVARYGGEEFIILMPGQSEKSAEDLAQTVRENIEAFTLEFSGKSISTTLSLGIASMTPGPEDREQDIISRADQALYHSKASGRNQVSYFNRLD